MNIVSTGLNEMLTIVYIVKFTAITLSYFLSFMVLKQMKISTQFPAGG